MNKETLRMQLLSGVITESEYKAKLKENEENEDYKYTYNDFVQMVRADMMAGAAPDEYVSDERVRNMAKYYYNRYLQGASIDDLFETKSKESLNENFVGMGMVGNIFDREKTDYELAFEHFAKGTSLNEEIEDTFYSPDDTNPVVQGYLKQLIDILNNQTDDMFDLKNLKYAVDKFSNMVNDEITKFEVEEDLEEGIHDKDITSAPHTNIKGELGNYDPKKRAANLAKLQNFGPKDKK